MIEEAPRVTAEELQARLALRSLCSRSFGTGGPGKAEAGCEAASKADADDQAAPKADAEHDEDAPHGFSLFQKRLMGEMEEVLRSGLARRMERLTSQLHGLASSGGAPAKPAAPAEDALIIATAKALQAAEEFSKPRELSYGPTFRQRRTVEEPPEQNTMSVVNEGPAMANTLATLRQSIAKRERQLTSLTAQFEKSTSLADEQSDKSKVVGASPESQKLFKDESKVDGGTLLERHMEILQRRRESVAELSRQVSLAKAQKVYYQTMHSHQQKYIKSIDRESIHFQVFRETGGSFMQHLTSASSLFREHRRSALCVPRLARHPAGEVFFSPPPPPPMGDERPEIFDIGCAIANPYITDSWPFEPNVSAQRSPEEAFMPKLEEETESDIEEENRPAPRDLFKALGARMSRFGSDDDEMPSSARSL